MSDLSAVPESWRAVLAPVLEAPEAPHRLPDIGDAINWRYQLCGTYRGEALG